MEELKMANGPKYRVAFRRRREGKTHYHRRLRLIRSEQNRLVIRCSNKHTTVQIVESKLGGDKILSQAHTSQLQKEYGWNYNLGNQPSAYLVGLLCGKRAIKAGFDSAILDVGIMIHDSRIKSAFKGLIDAGVDVPYGEEWISDDLDERVNGTHIQNYAQLLAKEDKAKYNAIFSKVLKNADPQKIVSVFDKTKGKIEQ